MVKLERRVVNGDLGFRRIILKCGTEPEVIAQGQPEGDHIANSRVELAVREVKRLYRTQDFH